MKEFIVGILVLIGSIVVSILVLWALFIYSLGYSIWLTITFKKFSAFFMFWWRLIDGIFAAIGYAFWHTAIGLDMIWNINGEMIEDAVTAHEASSFGNKEYTVSSSIGKLEKFGKLTKFGKRLSKFLNIVFWQKSHAIDAYHFQIAQKEIRNKYFQKYK